MATNPIVKKIRKIPLLRNIFEYYHLHSQLEKALKCCKTVLDLGCGGDSPFAAISKNFYSVGIDAFEPSIKTAKELGIHNEYFLMNVMDIDKKFSANSFDCILLTDLIEHLEKKDGILLIEKMQKIAKKKIVIFTPNGFYPQGEFYNNPFQVHKSGWDPKEMKERGYKVIGFGGLKGLRSKIMQMQTNNKFYWFWKIITESSEILVRDIPEMSFSILCVKTKDLL
ncbi:MAG: methyltransferase domain-containing protein [bacterium]